MNIEFTLEKLSELERQGVIIDVSLKKANKKFDIYSYDFVVESYIDQFIFQFDRTRFKEDTHLSSFFNLFDFEQDLSKKLFNSSTLIEMRLKAAVWDNARDFLIKELKQKQNIKFSYKKWNVNDIETNHEIKNAFIRLCKQHCSSEKKKINKFVRYIIDNKNKLSNKSVEELLDEFCSSNNKKINSLKLEFKPLKDELFKADFLKINFAELTENEIYNELNKSFDEFIARDMKKIITKDVNSLFQCNKWTSKKLIPIINAKNTWTFGTTVKIFESLNTEVKYEVMKQFFKHNKNIQWKDSNKINTFISIINNINIIRNKTAHHNSIYNFEIYKQSEMSVIYDFIKKNAPNHIHKISKNKINLFGILKCIDIFENRKVKSIVDFAHSLFNKYIYSNVFPESFVVNLGLKMGIQFTKN